MIDDPTPAAGGMAPALGAWDTTRSGRPRRGERWRADAGLARAPGRGAAPAILGLVAVLSLIGSPGAVTAKESRSPQQSDFLRPAEGESLTDWTAGWMEGPVQHIATADELELWESLQTTQERLQFIRLFWKRRDPRVRGRTNEFLEEFEQRVAYADEEFGDGGQPGWDTLFGRVVLVLGIPSRTRRELGLPDNLSDRPPILWTYDGRIPEWPPNEDLLFVFQRGRWRLMPPSPIGDTGVEQARRQLERSTPIAEIPSDFERATEATIDENLAQPVDYREAIRQVEATVAFPDAEIPFGWDASFGPGPGDRRQVTLDFTWRTESLIFHVVDDHFQTEMVVGATLFDEDGEPVAEGRETFNVSIPVDELESRAGDLVERTLSLEAPAGSWELEIVLEDRLLGYRTVYRDTLEVPAS